MNYPINIKEILKCKCPPVYGCCTLTSGYFASHGASGDIIGTGDSIELQDAFELWQISIDSGGDFIIDNWDGSQWVNVYEV